MGETNRAIWIGLIELTPQLGNMIFEGAPGAFSNVLCFASGEAEYRRMVEDTFRGLGFDVEAIADVERLEERLAATEGGVVVDDEILDLARQVSESQPILYDAFYVYESKE